MLRFSTESRKLLNETAVKFGRDRTGKSYAVESLLILVLYSFCYLFTFYLEMGLLNWQTALTLPLGFFLPLFVPSPLPLVMILLYFLFTVASRYFERSLFLYFLTGVICAAVVAGIVHFLVSLSAGNDSSINLMGEGNTGTLLWLLATMIGSSLVIRTLRLVKNRRGGPHEREKPSDSIHLANQ